MIENFSFTLKNNKAKLLKRVTWIWSFILLIILSILTFSKKVDYSNYNKVLIFLPLWIVVIVKLYFEFIKKDFFKGIQISLYLLSIIFIFQNLGVFFALCFALFFAFIYWFSYQNTLITFSKENIILRTGYIKRQIDWSNLNNVVLKDNILTLDFKNDKLIQEEVDGEVANEASFNLFSQNKLQ